MSFHFRSQFMPSIAYRWTKVIGRLCVLLFVFIGLTSCSNLSYWAHLAKGQSELLWKRENIDKLIEEDGLDDALRSRLVLSQKVRAFAEEVLLLPVGNAYSSYSNVERPYAVWNVYAAPELSLKPYTWCYPIVGCMAYRGFYKKEMAEKEAEKLKSENYDVRVGGVRAYSTIGFFDDPVMNTFVHTNEVYFVELLIHEIAHRKIYIKDDTKFNENFATAVALIGAEQWYKQLDDTTKFSAYQTDKERFKKIVSFLLRYKEKLTNMYEDNKISEAEKRDLKKSYLSDMMKEFQRVKKEENLGSRYDAWVSSMNNATFATLSNYRELVPGFLRLYRQVGSDWQKFYSEVERISRLPKDERHLAVTDNAD